MNKKSKLWQGFFVAGITALAVPTFVHGQAAGGAAGGTGSSGITSGSPSPSGSQTGVPGSQNVPSGSPSTSGNQSGVSDSNIGRTPGITGSQGTQRGSSTDPAGDTAGATNPNSMTSSPGGINRDVGSSIADQRLNAQIRQSLNADTSLSGMGRDVQLHTAQGEVTLRGSVGSEREKLQIEQKVKQQSQVQDVTNELQVMDRGSTSTTGINR
jgi:osmotically-inducible protein OsmY